MADVGMMIKVQAAGTKQASADIDKVTKSAADLEKSAKNLGYFFDAQGKLRDSSGKYAKATDEVAQSLRKMKAELGAAADGIGKFDGNVVNSTKSLGFFEKALIGAVTIQAIRNLFDIGDNYMQMSERVRMATDSLGEFEYAQNRLMASANTSFRPLAEAQELFIATNDNLRGLGYTLGQSLDITDSLSFAFVRNATAADKARTAIDTYDRVLSKGKMNAQEWQSISGGIGTLTKSIGDAFGKTAQEIDQLGHSGKLSATWLTEGLLRSLEDNRDAADSMTNTISDGVTRLKNEFSSLWGEANEGIGITSAVANGIIFISDNLKSALVPALIIGSVAAGKLTASAGATGVSLYKTAVAANKATVANYQLEGATLRAARAMTVGATAGRAWISSIAFLGGPVGALMALTAVATSGFMLFSSGSQDAGAKASALGIEVEELTLKLDRMNKARLEGVRDKYEGDLDDLLKQKKSLEREIRSMEIKLKDTNRSVYTNSFDIDGSARKDQIKKYNNDLEDLRGKLDDTNDALVTVGDFIDLTNKKISLAGDQVMKFGAAWGALQKSTEDSFMGPLKASEEFTSELDKIISKRKEIVATTKGELIALKWINGELGDITQGDMQRLVYEQDINDEMEKQKTNKASLGMLLAGIEAQYDNIGLSTAQIAINQAVTLGATEKQLAKLEEWLAAIGNAPKSGGKSSLNYFDDALKSINDELINTKALTQDLVLFGNPSEYTSFREMTMQLNDANGVLAKILPAQRELLLMKAQELDSQKQINAILNFGADNTKRLDDMEFEISLYGKSRKEIEKLTYFRELENDARLISIGMTQENIDLLKEEIEKRKELYGLTEKKKEDQENSIGAGIEAGMNRYIDSVGSMRDQFADATESVLGHMEGFLVDFAITGKASFRDMTVSILEDLSKMMIRMAMMQAVQSAMGLFSGGGHVGGSSVSYPYKAWTGGYIPEYATGGQVIDFSGGGFTGAGDKFEPKGIVHGGEFVMSKAAVNALGIDYLERLHSSAKSGKGYANGGYVGSSVPMGISGQSGSQRSDIVVNQTLHIESGANIDEQMIKKLQYEMRKEAMKISENISLRTIGDQKRSGGMLRG